MRSSPVDVSRMQGEPDSLAWDAMDNMRFTEPLSWHFPSMPDQVTDELVWASYDTAPLTHAEWDLDQPNEAVTEEQNEHWETERRQSHAADRIKKHPDCYVNCDVTITIDPPKNDHWMRDDSSFWRHTSARHRGAVKDHNSLLHTLRLVEGNLSTSGYDADGVMQKSHPKSHVTFQPTPSLVDRWAPDKLTPMCVANSTRGWRMGNAQGQGILYSKSVGTLPDFPRWGKLPIISQQMYDGTLGKLDTSGVSERKPMNFYRQENRTFECGPNAVGQPCR